MNTKEIPYIGVTGVSTVEEAIQINNTFKTAIKGKDRLGMVGYLVSNRTLLGEKERYEKYPPIEILPQLLAITAETSLNTIHYRTNEPKSLATQIDRLLEIEDIYKRHLCHGIQLNISWPRIDQVEEIKKKYSDLKLILSLNEKALRKNSRVEIVNHLKNYNDFINYIIIDPSGGIGKQFEENAIAPYYRAIKHNFPEKGVILAGGFNDENIFNRLNKVKGAINSSNFGIDAEGGLRIKNHHDPHSGELSLDKTTNYINKAANFFLTAS